MKRLKLQPVITEKTLRLLKQSKTYTFKGLAVYTAKDVREFLERVYGAKVEDIRVAKVAGKKRFNMITRKYYKVKPFKKFYVKFKGDVKIPGFSIK